MRTAYWIAGWTLCLLAFAFMWGSWWIYPAVRLADGSKPTGEADGMAYCMFSLATIAGLGVAGAWCFDRAVRR